MSQSLTPLCSNGVLSKPRTPAKSPLAMRLSRWLHDWAPLSTFPGSFSFAGFFPRLLPPCCPLQ